MTTVIVMIAIGLVSLYGGIISTGGINFAQEVGRDRERQRLSEAVARAPASLREHVDTLREVIAAAGELDEATEAWLVSLVVTGESEVPLALTAGEVAALQYRDAVEPTNEAWDDLLVEWDSLLALEGKAGEGIELIESYVDRVLWTAHRKARATSWFQGSNRRSECRRIIEAAWAKQRVLKKMTTEA